MYYKRIRVCYKRIRVRYKRVRVRYKRIRVRYKKISVLQERQNWKISKKKAPAATATNIKDSSDVHATVLAKEEGFWV